MGLDKKTLDALRIRPRERAARQVAVWRSIAVGLAVLAVAGGLIWWFNRPEAVAVAHDRGPGDSIGSETRPSSMPPAT